MGVRSHPNPKRGVANHRGATEHDVTTYLRAGAAQGVAFAVGAAVFLLCAVGLVSLCGDHAKAALLSSWARCVVLSQLVRDIGAKADHKVAFGRDGWLFYRRELQYLYRPWPRANPLVVQKVDSLLRTIGTQLILVPIPSKLDVYPEMFMGVSFEGDICRRRADAVNYFRKSSICTVDLLNALRCHGESVTYDPDDTHWNARGRAVAARTIADTILARGFAKGSLRLWSRDSVIEQCGDLQRLLDPNCDPRTSKKATICILSEAGTYRDVDTAQVVLVGDSFVGEGRPWGGHLGALLAEQLRVSTWTYPSRQGGEDGPVLIRNLLLKRRAPPKVVVWAFVSRVLSRPIQPFPD